VYLSNQLPKNVENVVDMLMVDSRKKEVMEEESPTSTEGRRVIHYSPRQEFRLPNGNFSAAKPRNLLRPLKLPRKRRMTEPGGEKCIID